MDIEEAINTRKSIRAFKPDPVSPEILQEILKIALKAPSWTNIQPWEFSIVTGNKLDEIRRAYLERIGTEPNLDIPRPKVFPEPYDTRRRTAIAQSQEAQGIKREDKEGRSVWERKQLTNFSSPCEIYIYTDRSFYRQETGINPWPIFDCGMVAENIMLLATKYGLGTIPQAQAVAHPDILRKALGIPDSKLIVVGLAIGYPDLQSPLNKFKTAKEPLSILTKWFGFGAKLPSPD
jgi:nitroreductase